MGCCSSKTEIKTQQNDSEQKIIDQNITIQQERSPKKMTSIMDQSSSKNFSQQEYDVVLRESSPNLDSIRSIKDKQNEEISGSSPKSQLSKQDYPIDPFEGIEDMDEIGVVFQRKTNLDLQHKYECAMNPIKEVSVDHSNTNSLSCQNKSNSGKIPHLGFKDLYARKHQSNVEAIQDEDMSNDIFNQPMSVFQQNSLSDPSLTPYKFLMKQAESPDKINKGSCSNHKKESMQYEYSSRLSNIYEESPIKSIRYLPEIKEILNESRKESPENNSTFYDFEITKV